jgi:GNAT superfamily N-acetyltransferase
METSIRQFGQMPAEELSAVHGWMRGHNVERNGPFMRAMDAGAETPLSFVAADAEGRVVGGLTGTVRLKWLLVDILVVAPHARGSGVGSALLRAAEDEGRRRGCAYGHLTGMTYHSPEFYVKRGWRIVGRIDDWDSHGHAKHFLVKDL